jgi:hypothetical protein
MNFEQHKPPRWRARVPALRHVAAALMALATALIAGAALAHGIEGADQDFLLRNSGPNIGPYLYLGAKHMVTGYDHLLFLAGVIFFLYRLKEVAIYVTLFAVGHSTTLLLGVLGGFHVNAYIVDAIIGFSVVYKAFENLGGFKKLGFHPNMKAAVLVFGFFHGFGLATKLQDLAISRDGLVTNMISFNVGVELGQFLALALILLAFNAWRASGSFLRYAYASNFAIMTAGFVLMGYQVTGYLVA